jgi:two-component system NtrC family sensor kinase
LKASLGANGSSRSRLVVKQPDAYRHLWRQTLLRLLLTYLAPLLVLTVYFHYQYRSLAEESRRRHLLSIVENQANTLDLFLRERVVNLTNLLDDPKLPARPTRKVVEQYLTRLKKDSDTFVDLGFFDPSGAMLSYAGPLPALLEREYGGEAWFVKLRSSQRRHVITDLYLGFRQEPHFTIAVRSAERPSPAAVRATLDPKRLAEYITTLKGSGEVQSYLVSAAGKYQTTNVPVMLAALERPLVPPRAAELDTGEVKTGDGTYQYSYTWLHTTDWALVAVLAKPAAGSLPGALDASFVAISAAIILAVLSSILIRTGQVVRRRRAEDAVKRELSGQLHHAARLASVGELAAGVAHEINNPLAIIAEESGLLRDMLDPQLSHQLEREELEDRLAAIHEAVFRARDITRKLLTFVRKTEVRLTRHDLNALVEDVIGGMLEREMRVANIKVIRNYAQQLPEVLADRGQLEQVLVNLVTNAIDAMPRGGTLTLSTEAAPDGVRVHVSDTGVGIAPEQLERIFMPFHTTKEVGKGTGLGLSVSGSIIQSYGGKLLVQSEVGVGSTFTLVIPVEPTGTEEQSEA